MPTPYETFLTSMQIDYEKWHDGVGYDLEALRKVSKNQLKGLELKLINRADRDWRDLEALAAINSQRAWLAITKVARAGGEQALYAAKLIANKRPDANPVLLETQLLRRIRNMPADAAVGEVIDAAEKNPTAAVKEALLSAARFSANGTFRCHAAALLVYLAGITKEPFDWNYRPLFLRFNSAIPRDVGQAYRELCTLLKISTDTK